MTHGATFLRGNYELPSAREPVKLSRERWEMLRRGPHDTSLANGALTSILGQHEWMAVKVPTEIDGVIFLPAEYVPARSVADDPQWEGNMRVLLKHSTVRA